MSSRRETMLIFSKYSQWQSDRFIHKSIANIDI